MYTDEANVEDLNSPDHTDFCEDPQGVDVTSQFNFHKTDDVIIDPPHDQLLSASDVTGADHESANVSSKRTPQDPGYSAINKNGEHSPTVNFLPGYSEAVEMLTEVNIDSSLQQIDFSPQNSAQFETANGLQELRHGDHTGQPNGHESITPENVTFTESTPHTENLSNTTVSTDPSGGSMNIEANGEDVLGVVSDGGAAALYESMNGSKLTNLEQNNSQIPTRNGGNNTSVNTPQHSIPNEVASMNNSTMPGNDASPKNIADGNNIDIKPIDDFPGPDSAAGGQHESGNGSNSMPAPSGSSTCGPSNENLNTNANAGVGAGAQTEAGPSGASCRTQQMFIYDGQGAIRAIDVDNECTVKQFAKQVADATGIPSDQTALVCKGRPLPRNGAMTLGALGILGASTVYQTVRGFGGFGDQSSFGGH